MSESVQDKQSIGADGRELRGFPDGVSIYDCQVYFDDRGSLGEMFNPDWGWHRAPLTYAYFFTVRPNKIKGWAYHKIHEDRYFLLSGDVNVVLFDDRPESSTYKQVFNYYLSDQDRKAINIPVGVVHATQNIGRTDAVLVNFPTHLYNREDPDKYRLPVDTDYIPFSFDRGLGW